MPYLHERLGARIQSRWDHVRPPELSVGLDRGSDLVTAVISERGIIQGWEALVEWHKNRGDPRLPPQLKAAGTVLGCTLLMAGLYKLGTLNDPETNATGPRLFARRMAAGTYNGIVGALMANWFSDWLKYSKVPGKK